MFHGPMMRLTAQWFGNDVACRRHVQLICGDGLAAGPFFQIANRDVDFIIMRKNSPKSVSKGCLPKSS